MAQPTWAMTHRPLAALVSDRHVAGAVHTIAGTDPTFAAWRDLPNADGDGVWDGCEEVLAQMVRPYFYTSPSDCDLRRDTYYSARRSYNSYDLIHIFYLLGYHRDCGDETFGTGHLGDSEFIIVNLHPYTSNPGAWFVLEAYYSAHYGELTDSGGWHMGSLVTYLQNGIPSAFVAVGKHGNYVTKEDCDAGAFFADSCDDNVFAGEWTMPSGSNVGNREVGSILKNCVASRIGFPSTECLWSRTGYFRGWSADRTSKGSTQYGVLLDDFNF